MTLGRHELSHFKSSRNSGQAACVRSTRRATFASIETLPSGSSLPDNVADPQLIYYASTRDNFRCIWAQRIGGRKPGGVPRVLHMHHFSGTHFLGWIYFSVAPDNPDVLLAEGKGKARMVKLDR